MLLVFRVHDDPDLKRYVIEFTGGETIGEVLEVFRRVSHLSGGLVLSRGRDCLTDSLTRRLNEYDTIVDMTEVVVSRLLALEGRPDLGEVNARPLPRASQPELDQMSKNVSQLSDMGFHPLHVRIALARTGDDVNRAGSMCGDDNKRLDREHMSNFWETLAPVEEVALERLSALPHPLVEIIQVFVGSEKHEGRTHNTLSQEC